MTFGEKLIARYTEAATKLGRRLTRPEYVSIADALFKEATKEKKRSSISEDAEKVYALYPRKVGRDDALSAITVALKKNELSYLLDKTSQFAEAVNSWPSSYRYLQDGGDRCPNPATWYRQGRYSDDPQTWRRAGSRNPGPQRVSKAPEGWRDWLEMKMPPDDHPAHGQLLSAYNCHKFEMMPGSWQAKCIAELAAGVMTEGVKDVENEMRLRNA